MTGLAQNFKRLYETDYHLWILEMVNKLENRAFSNLDLENLIEEIYDLSKRAKRKLQRLLIKLIKYLLKLVYWESELENNKGRWLAEIRNFR